MVQPLCTIELINGETKETLLTLKKAQITSIKGGGENALKFGVFVSNLLTLVSANINDVTTLQILASVNYDNKEDSKKLTNVNGLQIVTADYGKAVKKVASEIKNEAKKGTISSKIFEAKRLSNLVLRLTDKAKTQSSNEKQATLQKVKEYQKQLSELQKSVNTANLLSY